MKQLDQLQRVMPGCGQTIFGPSGADGHLPGRQMSVLVCHFVESGCPRQNLTLVLFGQQDESAGPVERSTQAVLSLVAGSGWQPGQKYILRPPALEHSIPVAQIWQG